MTTELTDEQINAIYQATFNSRTDRAREAPPAHHLVFSFARSVIAADRAQQSARHAEELAAYELTVSNLRTRTEELIAACVSAELRAERNPMHEGEIQAAWLGQDLDEPIPYTFVLGIRACEAFHGIKEKP